MNKYARWALNRPIVYLLSVTDSKTVGGSLLAYLNWRICRQIESVPETLKAPSWLITGPPHLASLIKLLLFCLAGRRSRRASTRVESEGPNECSPNTRSSGKVKCTLLKCFPNVRSVRGSEHEAEIFDFLKTAGLRGSAFVS